MSNANNPLVSVVPADFCIQVCTALQNLLLGCNLFTISLCLTLHSLCLNFFVRPGNQDASFFFFCPLKLKLKHKQALVLSDIFIGPLNNQIKHILYEHW